MPTVEELRRMTEEARAACLEAERRRDAAERGRDAAERELAESCCRQARPITLREYRDVCFELSMSGIAHCVKSEEWGNKAVMKHCPRRLTPWLDFQEAQDKAWGMVNEAIPGIRGLFESTNSVVQRDDSGQLPVPTILEHLRDMAQSLHGLSIDEHLRMIKSGRTHSQKNLVCVVECTVPHDLRMQYLKRGLREMDVVDEVVYKPFDPTEEDGRPQTYSELLATAAVAEAYHCMVDAGLEYGYIANEYNLVFLRIDWDNPAVLHYHISHPARWIEANDMPEARDAVGQVLALSALAIYTTEKSSNARRAATFASVRYDVDVNLISLKVDALETEMKKSSAWFRRHFWRVPVDPNWKPLPIQKRNFRPDSDRGLRLCPGREDSDAGAGGTGGAEGAEGAEGAVGAVGAVPGFDPGQAGSSNSGSEPGTASSAEAATASPE